MNKQTASTGIWLSLTNCIIALPALITAESYDVIRLLAILSFVLFVILLLRRLGNVLFLARTLFLGGIGYYPMMVKVLAGPDALFSLYEPGTQGFDIAIVMYVATSLAILGNEIGLSLGSRVSAPTPAESFARPSGLWRTIFYACIPIILLVSFLTIQAVGPTVFTATYASQAEGQLLGNTQNIGIICLLAVFVASYKADIRYGRAVFIVLAIVFLVWAMFLRGLRQDVVTAVLGIAVCYGLVRGREYRLSLKGISVVLAFLFVVELMGAARAVIATEAVTFTDLWQLMVSKPLEGSSAYHFGTVSPIATTFSNIVYLIDSKTMDLLFGKSFLEFIPRTPPEFLYPDRPRDYAWIFDDYGLGATGGIFELAEAYMNFGFLGVLLIPGIISFLMARAFYGALHRQSVISYFLLFTFLGMFLRGTWYQIFAFYKSFLTALILFVVFAVLHSLFRTGFKNAREGC